MAVISHECFSVDYEDDEWPENLGESKSSARTSGNWSSLSESNSLKRFAVHKLGDVILYNMGAMLAVVGAGYDIRISNTTAVHPQLQGVDLAKSKDHAHSNQLRDSIMTTADDDDDDADYRDHQFTSTAGALHHTYHGHQNRYRPSVTFDVPIHFTEVACGDAQVDVDGYVAPSTSSCPTDRIRNADKLSEHLSDDPKDDLSQYHRSLMSVSPSTDRTFVAFQKQTTDSSAVAKISKAPPGTTNKSEPVAAGSLLSPCSARLPDLLSPPPKPPSGGQDRQPIRYTDKSLDVDIISRPRPHANTGKVPAIPSSAYATPEIAVNLAASRSESESSHSVIQESRHRGLVSTQSRNLIDIDTEGQKSDETKPLPAKSLPRQIPVSELEREFL